MTRYKPSPIDTSQVEIPPELEPLVERLAKSAHDNWALQRFSDGWSHGLERDDGLKEHPDLVPYEELAESEKDYDRVAVSETIKAIVALGYRIGRGAKEDA